MYFFKDFDLFEKKYLYITTGQFLQLLKEYGTSDNIPGYSEQRTIVIDNASDPWGVSWIREVIKNTKPGVITAILCNDKKFVEENPDLNVRFFPVWAYRYTHKAQEYESINFFDKSRDHEVSCLNRIPKMHRIYTYFLLRQLDWNKKILLSFYGLSIDTNDSSLPWRGPPHKITLQQIQDELGSSVSDFFGKEISRFPLSWQTDYKWINCHRADTEAFANCYANVCTETTVDYFLPTEKIFKCITSGMLIFPVACENFSKLMMDLGVDINYLGLGLEDIDKISDWRLRTLATVQRVSQLHNQIEDIWNLNRHQLMDNQQKLLGGQISSQVLKNIKDLF
jgi:hypothetical protein